MGRPIVIAADAAERTLTVVVDALDEAADPGAVLTTLLARVNSPERQRLRLLVGVRSKRRHGCTGSGCASLASVAMMALGGRQIRVDDDEFWEPHDFAGYVEQMLSDFPYRGWDVASVADAVGAQSGRSYLVAGLAARALAGFDEPLAAGDPRLGALLARVRPS